MQCVHGKDKAGKLQRAVEGSRELTHFYWLFQAGLKCELFVLGKPPRSPVMSRRSSGSPIRGLSASHRVGSECPHAGCSNHLISPLAGFSKIVFVVNWQLRRAGSRCSHICWSGQLLVSLETNSAQRSYPKSLGNEIPLTCVVSKPQQDMVKFSTVWIRMWCTLCSVSILYVCMKLLPSSHGF